MLKPPPPQQDAPGGQRWIGSENQFRLLVESVIDYAVYMLDQDGYIVSWNPGAERIKGYGAAEVIGQHFSRFFTPSDQAAGKPQRALDVARRTGRFEDEGWRVRKDGTSFWALAVIDAIKDPGGRVIGFAKITRDITERRAVQEALRESERRFRLLVDSVTDYAIYMLDPDGNVAEWNLGAQRIKGYAAREIIGRHFSTFYTEADREAGLPQKGLATAARVGRYETEGWRLRKDGSRFWANVIIDPVRDETGTLIGYAKVTRDMTERRQAQIELERAREQLFQAQKMEALGQLTGGIAHDFNNMLTAIINSIRLAGAAEPGSGHRHLDAALQAAQSGAALVRQMLVFARRHELRIGSVEVNAVVTQAADIIRPLCGANVELVIDLAAGLPSARSDGNQLQSSIVNLAINGIDAMPAGGRLSIATALERRANGTEQVCITVADTGVGMSSDVLARAFEPFFTTKEPGKGTGLGLSMVYGAIRQSGGDVTIDSAPGKGTTVRMFLPAHSEGDSVSNKDMDPAMDQEDNLSGVEVLYVEDEPLVEMATTDVLLAAGLNVRGAPDGNKALALLREHPGIELIITDVGLPGMSGYDLIAEARRLKPNVKVVFVTGYDRTGTIGKLTPDQETDYVDKPYDPETLVHSVRRLLRDRDKPG